MDRLFMHWVCMGAAVLLAAACATTQPPEAAVATAEADAAVDDDYDPNEIICKKKKATGTRIGQVKDCRTAEQWRKSGSNAQRALDSLTNDGYRRPNCVTDSTGC